MKFNGANEAVQKQALEILETTEDKPQAILEVMELLQTEKNKDLIKQLQDEDEKLKADASYREKMHLPTLSKEEKEFYQKLKANQSIDFKQDDIIPTRIVDRTLEDVKTASDTLKLVEMAPADVKKWISAEKSGTFGWGGLTDALTEELSAKIESFNIDVNKLHVLLIIPKAVRDLSLEFVDKYFTAILGETMHDGMVDGYLNGTGKNSPIGIFKQVASMNEDGTHKDKTIATSVKGFSPKQLAPVKKKLSKGGKRKVDMLYLIANPSDVYEYVEPSLYYLSQNGYLSVAKTKIEVIEEPVCPIGKAVFTIDKKYTLGMTGVTVNEYKETKAIEDCDLIIAKCYANGRAVDDDTSYPFDVTKLEEYIPVFEPKSSNAA